MRTLITSVDYSHELSLCLAYNRHHWQDVLVVTSPADAANVRPIAAANGADVFVTDAFYRGGGAFRKFLAVEEALDHFGRRGWLCLADADVAWPKVLPPFELRTGWLYGPLRRMCPHLPPAIPPEETWASWPLHRNQREWPGFSVIFDSADEHLGPPPWHDTRLLSAGTGDSLFQAKWKPDRKEKLPFEVLHVGSACANWMGRATARADGSVPAGAAGRLAALRDMIQRRRSQPPNDRFAHERLPPEEA